MSGPTTNYGTWANYQGELTVEDGVKDAFLGDSDGFDIERVTRLYRDAINVALPGGICLHGSEFYGPHPRVEGYGDKIREAINSVDFWALVRASQADRGRSGDVPA